MRILHILFGVFHARGLLALAIARDPVGRVAFVVFVTLAAASSFCGTTAVMLLFQTVASIGDSRGRPIEYAQGLLATAVVLFVAAWLMLGMFSVCITVIGRVV